jgi:DNA-binding SARP family transcriptional activator
VFAYLALQMGRAVPRDELAEALWGEELPASWEKALRVLMTKLRALLEECGIDGSTALTSAFGCYQLALPPDAWIDVHAAASAVERAEAALAAGNLDKARDEAATAAGLSRPILLPGEDGPWVEEQRRELRDVLVRALECLRDASLAADDFGDAVRNAAAITELEPFRESSYRALMQAHVGAGNPAEALRVYERCRRFLADELGTYPSAESEALYLEILRSSSGSPTAEPEPSPLPNTEPPRRGRRTIAVLSALLVAGVATAAALAFVSRDTRPLETRPNSLVRLDPETFEPSQVVPKIGPHADLVVVAGGYVWVTHGVLRYTHSRIRDAGDRTLTRVDPSTGDPRTVGEVAPCGITPDPSGDVWVANCYASGRHAEVVRVDARTLKFEKHLSVPGGKGYYRGMAYGGASLWVAGVSGDPPESRRLTQLNPSSGGLPGSIRLGRHATAMAWSADYGDLWMTNFGRGSLSRMDAETGKVKTFETIANQPAPVVVQGGAVWVGDWEVPRVVRLPAVGSGPLLRIDLPMGIHPAGVTSIAAGAGGIWAAVPDDHAVWRIDPLHPTEPPIRIPLTYAPWGVAVGDDGGIWVALRGRETE